MDTGAATDITNDITTEITGGLVTDDQAELIWFIGELLVVRMPGALTGEQHALVEHVSQRGVAPPWHRHFYDDETFHVLDGEVALWCGDPSRPVMHAGPGDTAFLPRQVPHTFRVDSDTARFYTVSTPSGHELFYREAGAPASTRTLPANTPPDMAKVLTAAKKYGLEILGPPPRLGEDRVM